MIGRHALLQPALVMAARSQCAATESKVLNSVAAWAKRRKPGPERNAVHGVIDHCVYFLITGRFHIRTSGYKLEDSIIQSQVGISVFW